MHRRSSKVFEQHQTCTGVAPNCLSNACACLVLLKCCSNALELRLCMFGAPQHAKTYEITPSRQYLKCDEQGLKPARSSPAQHQTCTGVAPNCLSFVSAWLPCAKISFWLRFGFVPIIGILANISARVTFWNRATGSKFAFARPLSIQMRLERSNMHRCNLWCSASAQTCTGIVFGNPRALKHAQV